MQEEVVRLVRRVSTKYQAELRSRGLQWCAACQSPQPLDCFFDNADKKYGKSTWCIACNQAEGNKEVRYWRRVYKKYGVTRAEYERRAEAQGYVCALCGEPERVQQRLLIDHDHETGKVRDLLCHLCNVGLGNFRDDPRLLDRAKEYLKKHLD